MNPEQRSIIFWTLGFVLSVAMFLLCVVNAPFWISLPWAIAIFLALVGLEGAIRVSGESE